MTTIDERLVFNGINGATGGYLLPKLTVHDIARIAQGEPLDKEYLNDLKYRHQQATAKVLRIKEDIDPNKLSEAGWGIIFAHSDSDKVNAIKEALGELLRLRQQQAGELYNKYVGVKGYRSGESKNTFLARHGAGPGPVNPTKVPYYLLIVGNPEAIPYRFQYQLAVQYAVGRIDFETMEEYARYAHSVVEAEQGNIVHDRGGRRSLGCKTLPMLPPL